MKNIKKIISLLLSVAVLLCTLSTCIASNAYISSVEIDATHFPDENFRAVVSAWYDSNNDNKLSADEVRNVKIISITAMLPQVCGKNAKIEDLTGIQYFEDCQRLRCANIGLKKLPVSSLLNLIELTCMSNALESIDLSRNSKLQILNCADNKLTSLNLTSNPALQTLDCHTNKISSINYSQNAFSTLESMSIYQNEFTSLDVSSFTALTNLNCSNNHLTSLDLSANESLGDITDANLGSQTVTAPARYDSRQNKYYVRFAVPNWRTNLVSTSCDVIEEIGGEEYVSLGYNGTDFLPETLDNIIENNGVDYYYNTGLASAESMSVHVNAEREFHQVKFYRDETKTVLYNTAIVNNGEKAKAPTPTDPPQCYVFDHWSKDFSNVTEDLEVYAVWAENHKMSVVAFTYNEELTINCTACHKQESIYDFEDLVNARKNEMRYVPLADTNQDGIINAKDFALLIRQFR